MDGISLGDIGPYLSMGPFGIVVFMLARDNYRLRSEVKERDETIEKERTLRFEAEAKRAAADAENAGLRATVAALSGGAGHA